MNTNEIRGGVYGAVTEATEALLNVAVEQTAQTAEIVEVLKTLNETLNESLGVIAVALAEIRNVLRWISEAL